MTMMTDRVYLVASMEYLISPRQPLGHYRIRLQAIEGRSCQKNEYTIQESNQEHISNNGKDQSVETIDSLRELRRVLGRQSFDRLIWNSLIGNQVIVRGEESGIVREIIKSLENILPKDCCDIIMDSPVYEPSYACNILGLDRSVPIPSDMDPQDFILLDICMNAFDHQISTPSISHPADNNRKDGSENVSSIYQADWSSTTLVADMTNLSTQVEKSSLTEQTPASDTVDQPRTPTSSPDVLYSPREGFQAQKRRYLLQAGEEPPEALATGNGMINGKDTLGRKAVLLQNQQYPLYIETVNGILDLKMPRSIEIKRLVVLREEWISKSKQFHNLYKAGYASDESVLARYLQSMQVDKRDLKILRFFTRCARSSSFQHQKYHSEDPMAAAAVEIKRDASD
ncbi:hypothetical protein BGZ51_007244 [Haplosporangium sp. Z 767]|nr:hypothetical protein BGZ51_007244 [Haplosporangium sp. Z 767]